MSIKKDKVQIDIEINGKKAGKTYGELIGTSRRLKKELAKLTPGTDAFVKKSAELKKVNDKLATIRQQTRGVAKGMEEATKKTGSWGRMLKTIGPALGVVAIYQGIKKIIGGIIRLGTESVRLFNIQAQADAQLRAGLESTRQAAGRTFEELKKQASDLQKTTLFGDEQIEQAQSIMLTFTQIKDTIYDQSIPAILDMSTKLGVDLKSASIQVGKALNDPIKGVTALSRAGVQFTEQQKEQIKALQQSGRIAEAQTIILKELETQFSGSAEAAAKAGTGGLKQLSNRINDIKEGIGLLINNGLKKIQPFLTTVVEFFEKLTQSVISGEKATGKFSQAINITIGIFKALGKAINIVYQYWKFLITEIFIPVVNFIYNALEPAFMTIVNAIKSIIEWAQKLPIIGTIIEGIKKVFSFFGDVIQNAAAAFAGLKAGAEQAVINIRKYFSGLLDSAKIFALKFQKALTISKSKRQELAAQIRELENLKEEAAKSGKTVGEAYVEARDRAIKNANEKAAKEAVPPPSKYQPPPTISTATTDTTTIAAAGSGASPKSTSPKISASSGSGTGEYLGPFKFVQLQVDNVKKYIDDQFKMIEEAGGEKLDLLEKQFLEGALTEEAYNEEKLLQKQSNLEHELEMMRLFGAEETKEYRKKELEKLRVQKQISEQRISQSKREADLKKMIENQSMALLKDSLQFGIELLGKDEEAKKKYAGKIKALQIALVWANVFTEISGIWKNANENPINAIIPGWGVAFATIQSALALGRASLASSNISKQKLYTGGFTGWGGKYEPAGIVHRSEYVLNMEEVNAMGGPAGVEKWKAIALRGYADGGVVTDVDTTPVGVAGIPVQSPAGIDFSNVERKLDTLIGVMSSYPRLLKAFVAIDEFEAAQENYHDSIESASI